MNFLLFQLSSVIGAIREHIIRRKNSVNYFPNKGFILASPAYLEMSSRYSISSIMLMLMLMLIKGSAHLELSSRYSISSASSLVSCSIDISWPKPISLKEQLICMLAIFTTPHIIHHLSIHFVPLVIQFWKSILFWKIQILLQINEGGERTAK